MTQGTFIFRSSDVYASWSNLTLKGTWEKLVSRFWVAEVRAYLEKFTATFGSSVCKYIKTSHTLLWRNVNHYLYFDLLPFPNLQDKSGSHSGVDYKDITGRSRILKFFQVPFVVEFPLLDTQWASLSVASLFELECGNITYEKVWTAVSDPRILYKAKNTNWPWAFTITFLHLEETRNIIFERFSARDLLSISIDTGR